MNRYFAPILVGLFLAGCTSQDQVPSSDPFLVGRTRIPPPGTGAATGKVADPYYPGMNVSPAPGWQPPAATTAPTATSAPVGGAAKAADPRFTAPSGAAPAATSPSSSVAPPAATTPGVTYPGVSLNGPAVGRGASLQGARTLGSSPAAQPSPLRPNAGVLLDDRTPRPIDTASGSAPAASAAPVNIMDLPAAD